MPSTRYSEMMDSVRHFLSLLGRLPVDEHAADTVIHGMRQCIADLEGILAEEGSKSYDPTEANVRPGQIICPEFQIEHQDTQSARAKVVFDEYFQGYNSAIHGGAIATLFDQMMGVPANSGAVAVSRTAYLKIDFRSVVPPLQALDVTVHVDRIEGRKRIIRGQLVSGDRICAEAEALFIELRPDQR